MKLCATAFCLLFCVAAAAQPAAGKSAAKPQAAVGNTYDILIRGGRIYDGTGNPWFEGDVGIRFDRIVAIGKLGGAKAKRVIDATGMAVSPGFIDMLGQSETALLIDNRSLSKLSQGITSEITGEGGSIAPQDELTVAALQPSLDPYHLKVDWHTLQDYWLRLDKKGTPINLGTYVGAAQVREAVLGDVNRAPTAAELEKMKGLVALNHFENFGLVLKAIHFGQYEQRGRLYFLDEIDGLRVFFVDARERVDYEEDNVRVYRRTNGIHHSFVEERVGLVNAGGIDEDDLRFGKRQHALDCRARRLGARRDDRELLAEQSVQQAKKAFEEIIDATQRAVSTFGGHASTTQASAMEFQRKVLGYSERNVAASPCSIVPRVKNRRLLFAPPPTGRRSRFSRPPTKRRRSFVAKEMPKRPEPTVKLIPKIRSFISSPVHWSPIRRSWTTRQPRS